MNLPEKCPHCGFMLDDGDVYESFICSGKSPEEALEIASHYGWTKENRQRFSKIVAMYNLERDRTINYICPKCERKIDVKRDKT